MRFNRQQGVALISALVVVVLISWIVSYLIWRTNSDIKGMQQVAQRIEAEMRADSWVDRSTYLHIKTSAGEAALEGWNYAGTAFSPEEGVSLSINDASTKLSLMHPSLPLMRTILVNAGIDEQQVATFSDCFTDWNDQDDLKMLLGGESSWYEQHGLPGPRNGMLQSVAEAKQICGWTEEIHHILMQVAVLQNGDGVLNPVLAPDVLLDGLSLSEVQKEQIRELRGTMSPINVAREVGLPFSEQYRYDPSNTLLLEVEVRSPLATAHRTVMINFEFHNINEPVVQYWSWSD